MVKHITTYRTYNQAINLFENHITSVVKNGSRLWTIAKIGSKVEVVGNDLEPAYDITSALSKMTIKKRTDIGTGFTAKLNKAQYKSTQYH